MYKEVDENYFKLKIKRPKIMKLPLLQQKSHPMKNEKRNIWILLHYVGKHLEKNFFYKIVCFV